LKFAEEIIDIIKKARTEIINKRDVLFLINLENSRGSPAVIREYKEFSKEVKKYLKKDAVFGMSGLHKIFLSSIRVFAGITMQEFDTKEQAMDYLIE